MDRRRFVPKAEGLEVRSLLSTNIFGATGTSNTQRTIQNMPDTWVEKTNRVDHLPYYLQEIDTETPLPTSAISSVQEALRPIIGNLHAANTDVVESFNLALRDAYPHKSLSVTDASKLNNTFGNVLKTAGATEQQVSNLKSSMNLLAQGASNSTQPVVVASNEYAIVLQIGLGIGRPIATPESTRLAAKNGIEINNDRAAVTPLSSPEFIGTYLADNKSAIGTTIQVVDSNGVVHAQGPTNNLGNYTTTIVTPFKVGTYKLFTRAVDSGGHMSLLSNPYQLKVVPRRVR